MSEPNISPSASISNPGDATPEEKKNKERIDRIFKLAERNNVQYGWNLAEYLIGLQDRITALEKALKEKSE